MVEGEALIRCAHGDHVMYHLADVCLTVGGKCPVAQVEVARKLPVSAILKRDVSEVLQLLKWEIVLGTLIRAHNRRKAQKMARVEEQNHCSGPRPGPLFENELQGTTAATR